MQEQGIDGGVGVWWAGITSRQSEIMQCRIISDGWVQMKMAFRMMEVKAWSVSKDSFTLLIPCIINF